MTQNELERKSLLGQLKRARQAVKVAQKLVDNFKSKKAEADLTPFDNGKLDSLEADLADAEDNVWAIEQDLKDLDNVE